MRRPQRAEVEGRVRVLWILHFAFVAAVPHYVLLTYFVIAPQFAAETRSLTDNVAALVLVLVGLIAIPLGFVLPVMAVRSAKDAPADQFATQAQTRMIVSDAVFESIAVYGLVGVFLEMEAWLVYGLQLLSLLLLTVNTVRVAEWVDEYRRRSRTEQEGAGFQVLRRKVCSGERESVFIYYLALRVISSRDSNVC